MAEDVVEDLDLRFTQALGVMQEKIGDLPEGFDAPGGGTIPDRLFEFINNGSRLHCMPLSATS
jgi:hypothetical protein